MHLQARLFPRAAASQRLIEAALPPERRQMTSSRVAVPSRRSRHCSTRRRCRRLRCERRGGLRSRGAGGRDPFRARLPQSAGRVAPRQRRQPGPHALHTGGPRRWALADSSGHRTHPEPGGAGAQRRRCHRRLDQRIRGRVSRGGGIGRGECHRLCAGAVAEGRPRLDPTTTSGRSSATRSCRRRSSTCRSSGSPARDARRTDTCGTSDAWPTTRRRSAIAPT